MQNSRVINFPDRSSEDSTFSAFWEECREAGDYISCQRAKQLFHATPEQYFKNAGWVYVLGNQYFADDVYKIGRTSGRIEKRMRQLYTTGVPGEFDCVHADWFSDCCYAEAFIHERLQAYRLGESREFFWANLDKIHGAFLTCHAFADPCPDHMVEQKLKRERHAMLSETIRGTSLVTPSDLEVPF